MQKSQIRDQKFKARWDHLITILSDRFSHGQPLEIEGVLYLVGLQELGQVHRKMKKDENVNLIHIGICTVLEPYGYYRFDFFDEEGWPHFKLLESLPVLKTWRAKHIDERGLGRVFFKT